MTAVPLPIAALAAASYLAPALVAPFFRRMMLQPRRHVSAPPALTLRAADERLDLDDVGAVQGKQHRGVRPCDALREIEDGNAVVSAFDRRHWILPRALNVRLPVRSMQALPCREAMRA